MTPTIRSKTPCPECGGHEWRRWAFVWPLGWGEADGRWLQVAQSTSRKLARLRARVDWTRSVAGVMDGVDGVDLCTRCGLVIR